MGNESIWAAEAAECAGMDGAFWEYHDYLYAHQSGENRGAFSQDNLKKFASDLGLDTKAFNECLDSGGFTSIIESETSDAKDIGVRSTPTFIINGKAVIGAQSFEVFKQIIDELLNQ